MHLSFQKILGICLIAVVVFIAVFAYKDNTVVAQSPSPSPECRSSTSQTPMYGWAWSSNIGWISFNSFNSGSGGGPHCVKINTSDGTLTGWAWSSNIGWIKFGNLSGFPSGGSTAGNARIDGGKLVGWARACAATVNKDCTSATRGQGWDGWIELSGVNQDGQNRDITYTNNSISGFAWGADVIGWLQFNATTDQTGGPPAQASCSLSREAVTTATHRLTWSSQNMSYCSGQNFPAGSVSGTSGSVTVTPTQTTVYTVLCTPTTGGAPLVCAAPQTITVTQPPAEAPELQMWLNNDVDEDLQNIRIRSGSPARINWKITSGEEFSSCFARVGPVGNTSLISDFGDSERPNGEAYTIPNLPIGSHIFTLSCLSGETNTRVNAAAVDGSTQLRIQVVDPLLEEI